MSLWGDQRVDFTQAGHNLHDPYLTPRFVYPPWTAVFLWPLTIPPLAIAVLLQNCLLFSALTLVIYRYGGNRRAVIVTFSSFFAMDLGLEANIDWLPVLGLLVPPALSGPLLLTKPQVALGIWFSYNRRQWVQGTLVVILTLIISIAVWGFWWEDMLEAVRTYTLVDNYFEQFNLAPSVLLPMPISPIIGLGILYYAFRTHDPVYTILAWIFFVPYVPVYTLIVYLALVAVRLPLLALIIVLAMWVIDGGAIALGLLLS